VELLQEIAQLPETPTEPELISLRQDVRRLENRLDKFMTMISISPVQLESFGSSDIPSSVPGDATHVLIFCDVQSGHMETSRPTLVKLENNLGHKLYFRYVIYRQNAWSYNSENVWMKIGTDRKVYISGEEPLPFLQFSIIGYK